MQEMEVLIKNFAPEEVERYTGFCVGERSYKCPLCSDAARKMGGNPNFAQLKLDEKGLAQSLYCCCCCEDIETIAANCQDPNCDSVFLDKDGLCLNCGYENEVNN